MKLKNNINNKCDAGPTADNYAVGGRYKEWNILNKLSHIVERKKIDVSMEVSSSKLKNKFEFENPRIVNPSNYTSNDELFSAVKKHWIDRLENSTSTINKRLTAASRMSNHSIFPIDFFDLQPDQIDAYVQYRKHIEKAGPDAIRNDLKTIYTFARAYGINYASWNIVAPKKRSPKKKIIPKVSDVYNLIHYKYSSDPYENALYQYLMYFSFLIGMRCPSELYNLKTGDIYLDDGLLVIHEDKKYGQDRQIIPEPVIISGQTRKSFKNWIDCWRPQAIDQYSKDYLFIQPSGKPFSKEYLRCCLSEQGKRVWSYYSPKKARDWCAIARLIKSKIETGNYAIYEVRDWLGHENVTTTQAYTKYADQYYRRDPYDWIRAILKYNAAPPGTASAAVVEEKSTEPKLIENNKVLKKSYLKASMLSHGSVNRFFYKIKLKLFDFFSVLDFHFHLIKLMGVCC